MSHLEYKVCPNAPTPNARYSHTVVDGNRIVVCGWMGDEPQTGKIKQPAFTNASTPVDAKAQTEQIMFNILACLEHSGVPNPRIVRRRLYFTDLQRDLRTVDEVWGRYVKDPQPVSTAVQVGALAKPGAVIEIEVEAVGDRH